MVVPFSRRFTNVSHFPGSNSGVAAAVIAGGQNMFVQGICVITFPAKFVSGSAQIAIHHFIIIAFMKSEHDNNYCITSRSPASRVAG